MKYWTRSLKDFDMNALEKHKRRESKRLFTLREEKELINLLMNFIEKVQ